MIRSIIDFAIENGLDKWDLAAFVISFFSFSASVISIGIAFKTLKSQIKTQNNTKLLLSQNAGYEYIKSYITYIIISYLHLTVFDNIAKYLHHNNKIICDYNPSFLFELSLPNDGIRPDQFISDPIAYEFLYKARSCVNQYNGLVDYIKKRILGNAINVNVLDKGEFPDTHIDEAQELLRNISWLLIQTIMLIKSKNENGGEELSEEDKASLKSEIDAQIMGDFTAILNKINKNNKNNYSQDLDECVFDKRILDWIINDKNIKVKVSSIYDKCCRTMFCNKGKSFTFRRDTKLTKKEIIVDEIRALFLKGESDSAYRIINDYFVEDINNIGRKALTFNVEEMQNGFFRKEVRRIRKFYETLYGCINSRIPQSLESIDFNKWNSFNSPQGEGPWTPPEIHLSGGTFKIMRHEK